MFFLILSAILILVSAFLPGANGMSVSAAASASLLIFAIMQRRLTAWGAFVFMSFLFFGMRPMHILANRDLGLFRFPFRITVTTDQLADSLWWAVAGLFCFVIGALLAKSTQMGYWRRRLAKAATPAFQWILSQKTIIALIAFQIASLVFLRVLTGGHRGYYYGSGIGAYLYDLPQVLQGGHVFTLVVIFDRWRKNPRPQMLFQLVLSSFLFLIFTYEMRNMSMFRGFYITGVMAAGIAVLSRWLPRVGYAWLILPIAVLLPLFQSLGSHRQEELAEAVDAAEEVTTQKSNGAYWDFFDASGDMNIFDTFVAADAYHPEFRPYALSWLYVPFHLVPRALWKDKPAKGTLQDIKFTHKAPYSPGIAGFFVLDGGRLWMLGAMLLLGYVVGFADMFILTMPDSALKSCAYGIFVVNGMYLTRFFLWQWFYQVLYALIPCIVLCHFLLRRARRQRE